MQVSSVQRESYYGSPACDPLAKKKENGQIGLTENSDANQLRKYNEIIVNPVEGMAFMRRVRTFARDGLKITTYICKRNAVEICYTFDGNRDVHDEDELREELADHLKIDSQLIKMTKLRAKPIYKETARPGEIATIQSKGPCKIGAFVHVAGKGNHALMSGHEKTEGDVVLYPNGTRLGVVNVSLHPSRQPPIVDCYPDVALARLDQQHLYTAKVTSVDYNGPLGLQEQPIEAEEDMRVRCFDANGNRGKVDSTMYIRRDDELEIYWRLISVNNDDGEPIHAEGDSGVLVVHDAPSPVDGVEAVGMLVGIDELHLGDNTTRRTSLAAPLLPSFAALKMNPYCSKVAIKFLK